MRAQSILLAVLTSLGSSPSFAGDPQDLSTCQSLAVKGQPGLYLRTSSGQLLNVNGSSVVYEPEARLYYVGNKRPEREAVWTVRTKTVARSAKANEAMLWRPGIVTECSGGRTLESFGRDDRFVSLQRYYQHHAPPSARRRDDDLSRKFHMPMRNSDGQCTGRTDDPQTVGPLQEVYRFEDVNPGPLVVERASEPRPARADIVSSVYSGLTSEIAHVSSGEPTCFGFAAPLPTSATVGTQILGGIGWPFSRWERYSQALQDAQKWQPSKTIVILRELNGAGNGLFSISWAPQQ
ncbi:hypothetical protein GGD63_006943 [Bradyrhizobium sp. cir1]|nr:hypothetical protein [Bradyrhizobium sp. cir1]